MQSEQTFESLIDRLEKLYGKFDFKTKKFVEASNSTIARELGYSDAQFSRLINEHATEGEYERANKNTERLLNLIAYEEKFNKMGVDPKKALASSKKRMIFMLVGIIIGAIVTYIALSISTAGKVEPLKYDMLKWTFESNFINPYKGLRDIPADCDYECYKYQGRWELNDEYKLPFLRESSGFHYLAKSVVSYIRCSPNNNPHGKIMQGFEYQKHEIWYDILERPIGTFIMENGIPNEFYTGLRFTDNDDFIYIGEIHTFYTNDFLLDTTGVFRQGIDIGRDIDFVSDEELSEIIGNNSLVEKIKREVTLIVQDPLHDFSKPSSCNPADKPVEDFHAIANGDIMSFDCQMTTAGRFAIRYNKSYVLKDQFVKDRCVSLNEPTNVQVN